MRCFFCRCVAQRMSCRSGDVAPLCSGPCRCEEIIQIAELMRESRAACAFAGHGRLASLATVHIFVMEFVREQMAMRMQKQRFCAIQNLSINSASVVDRRIIFHCRTTLLTVEKRACRRPLSVLHRHDCDTHTHMTCDLALKHPAFFHKCLNMDKQKNYDSP